MIKRLLLLAALAPPALADIDRVEPPSWWTGMAEPTVQLLVHGEDLGQYQPSLDYPGVTIEKITRTDNDNYVFVDLRIEPGAQPGQLPLRFSRAGHANLEHRYPLAARAPGSAQRPGYGGQDVILLITPDRFANGDPDNDSVAGLSDKPNRKAEFGRHGGDLRGIIEQLDYLQGLGITQLWLNPVLANAQPRHSYHGYAITDFYAVDPRFGDNALYQTLSQEANKRGLGLIMDLVLNHAGGEHWWLKDLPAQDWINYNAQFQPTNHRRESLRDPYAAASDRSRFSDGWFVESMPDLNQRNPLLANYLAQNAIWWLEYATLSGLRIDTWPYSDPQFLVQWSQRILREYPNLNFVGEEWATNNNTVAYWQRGKRNADGYQSLLPGLFDFPLQAALVAALTQPESWSTGLTQLYQLLADDGAYADPFNLVIFPDNHDMSRIHSQLGGDARLTKMALAVIATMRGVPQFYYGTELLMDNPGTESHGIIRSDFPGGWAGDRVNAFTGRGLSRAQRDMQQYFRALLNWRKRAGAVHTGKLLHYAPEDGVYVYFRYTEQQRVMVVLNKNPGAASLDLARFGEMLDGFTQARDVLANRDYALRQPLKVEGLTARIFELK